MIDFCEIDWKTGDKWQEFAQIFLRSLGYDVIFPPGRGPDGGKDLLVAERLPSPSGARIFKWLVSCKHTAQSGSAIGTSQEVSIIDSMAHHQADGFMGFYSVGATQALLERLQSYRSNKEL
ncbi:PDDEXK family nuclease [Novacetimonas maltaceti]|uniref:restriction endonuclease n=1 Tax=Novacetimonas maltaceti TaxID=1203393 RepID=UPI000D724D82|nr:restriction endonuclease [Novacetimonas maltaceti]